MRQSRRSEGSLASALSGRTLSAPAVQSLQFCTQVVLSVWSGYRSKNMKDMADRINDHYERHAREWDADRNLHVSPWNDKPWRDRFVAALPRAASVLDLGCGSGAPVAKYMAECGLHVTGVDSSPTLISLCRQRLPDHEWLVDDMRSLRLSRRFDGALAWDSLFHLTPRRPASDVRRLRPTPARRPPC